MILFLRYYENIPPRPNLILSCFLFPFQFLLPFSFSKKNYDQKWSQAQIHLFLSAIFKEHDAWVLFSLFWPFPSEKAYSHEKNSQKIFSVKGKIDGFIAFPTINMGRTISIHQRSI